MSNNSKPHSFLWRKYTTLKNEVKCLQKTQVAYKRMLKTLVDEQTFSGIDNKSVIKKLRSELFSRGALITKYNNRIRLTKAAIRESNKLYQLSIK